MRCRLPWKRSCSCPRQAHTRPLRGTHRAPDRSPDYLRRTRPRYMHHRACRRSRRYKACHRRRSDCRMHRSRDRRCPQRGIGRSPRTPREALRCSRRQCRRRSSCTGRRRRRARRRPWLGSSTRLCSRRSCRRRGIDPRQSTRPGSSPRTAPRRTHLPPCKDSHRRTSCRRLGWGSSRRPLPGHSYPRRGIDPLPRRSRGWLRRSCLPDTYRLGCRGRRRCKALRRAWQGSSTCPSPNCTRRRRGTDRRPHT